MPDFIIGEHIIFGSIGLLSGASVFSAFPNVVLLLVNLFSILTVFILTLRIFQNKNIASLTLLLLGVLYAVSSPQAKFVSGGVIGNILGNLLMPDARRAVSRGYRVLKLKLGAGGLAQDEARLEAIRAGLGTRVGLRIDANGAWSRAEAQERVRRWSRFGLELVEQPVAGPDLEGLARLARDAPVPVAADEALCCAEGRDALVRGELTALAVLKPAVQGGLAPALDLARRAARRGVACVVTTTLDGPLGTGPR